VRLPARLWHSPTFTTWGSTVTRSLSLFLVLPLLLRRLDPAEVAIWYLLAAIISLQGLADLGFAPTFTRLIAYAMGGKRDDAASPATISGVNAPDWQQISRIWSTMRVVYWRLTAIAFVLLAVFGSWSLLRPMRALEDPLNGWLAWTIVLLASTVLLWAGAYASYLQGLNHVALLRRWEALSSIAGILTSFVVLLLGGRLLAVVLANQGWVVVGLLRNRQLARTVEDARLRSFRAEGVDPGVLASTWPSAWRSALGVLFSRGVVQASGPIYAQVAQPVALSSFLITLRVMQFVVELAQAPFYSRIPILNRLRSEGRFDEQLKLARRAMRQSHWAYAIGFVAAGLTATAALRLIGSQVEFSTPALWAILGLGFLLERFGAMHLQLYSTTNHILWHIANGVTGTIYLSLSLALLAWLDVYAFPVALLASYLCFYSWYSARLVYGTFHTGFFEFERSVFLPAATVVALYAAVALLV
jgi:hypothetical protein